MYRETGMRAAITTGIFAILCTLAACGPGSRDETAADDAAQQNADRMSREHAADNGTPSAGAAVPPGRDVVAETLAYAEVDEELVYGHFVFPADMVDPLPGLIVVHEWWGLNDGVRAMADRLAAEGYIVLAVDLFGGKTAELPPEARELMLGALQRPELAEDNLRQAYEFIRDTGGAPKIGSLGWCFGGAWALNTALLFPDDLDAAVIYYGQVPSNEQQLAPLNVPILGLFAENDRGIPVETVQSFEQALRNLDKEFEIEIYSGVGHAFANPSGTTYNAEAAGRAWDRTIDFLQRHMRADQ
ncbi:MAG TPA: dienelactone hydrolase family protein [Woeseiaceae bacterium]